jgi:hypothetical protein
MYAIQHCYICRPSDFTVSEDAGIEPGTIATSALTARRSNHSARSNPQRSPHTIKKVSDIPVPSRDVTYQSLPGQE